MVGTQLLFPGGDLEILAEHSGTFSLCSAAHGLILYPLLEVSGVRRSLEPNGTSNVWLQKHTRSTLMSISSASVVRRNGNYLRIWPKSGDRWNFWRELKWKKIRQLGAKEPLRVQLWDFMHKTSRESHWNNVYPRAINFPDPLFCFVLFFFLLPIFTRIVAVAFLAAMFFPSPAGTFAQYFKNRHAGWRTPPEESTLATFFD